MTRARADKILEKSSLYYGVFPVTRENINHKIIKQVVELIKRIEQYTGMAKGYNALPQHFIGMRYDELYNTLVELREQVNRGEIAYREALNALNDAEEYLNYIFI